MPAMKLSLCMLFPSLAAGFAVQSGAGRSSNSVSFHDVSSSVGPTRLPIMALLAEEQQSEAARAEPEEPAPEQTNEVDPPSDVASEASDAPASEQEMQASSPVTFVQTKAAPTFSATAPAGMPPEINAEDGGYQKFRTLDQEMNARAVQRGFAQTQGVKASMAATDVSNNPNSGYYKYSTLNQLDNQKAAQSGFARSRARATFSATETTNNAGGGGFYKYKTLAEEDNERALNASYRVTYSATEATDSASGSSNIPVVQKKPDEDGAEAPVEEKEEEEEDELSGEVADAAE